MAFMLYKIGNAIARYLQRPVAATSRSPEGPGRSMRIANVGYFGRFIRVRNGRGCPNLRLVP
jgi:hypothetical protein